MRKNLTPAQKAARTRAAREGLKNRYGVDTYNVVRSLQRGESTVRAAVSAGVWPETAAAIKANLTRGTYDNFVGDCNF